jgi:hypothetical protein
MASIPLDLQKRCEQRWAARFARPAPLAAPKGHQPESQKQQLAATPAVGVDPAVVRAVGQVVLMDSGQDYEPSWLIPEVTRLMNDTDDGLSREQNESKLSFCKRWGDALVEKGLIQKKVDSR